jgi:hypothetical protein
VVLAVGICSSDESSDVDVYIEAVDRWVLSDDEYAASLEGMECLILKSKWYADVGQPRRAWIAYRKGLMYAQLMVSKMTLQRYMSLIASGPTSQAHFVPST